LLPHPRPDLRGERKVPADVGVDVEVGRIRGPIGVGIVGDPADRIGPGTGSVIGAETEEVGSPLLGRSRSPCRRRASGGGIRSVDPWRVLAARPDLAQSFSPGGLPGWSDMRRDIDPSQPATSSAGRAMRGPPTERRLFNVPLAPYEERLPLACQRSDAGGYRDGGGDQRCGVVAVCGGGSEGPVQLERGDR
jgi:hypothetical protein